MVSKQAIVMLSGYALFQHTYDLADYVYALNKQSYGSLAAKSGANIQEGVIFLTYSSLVAHSDKV
eukprot:scaffold311485_cov16-Prasinocladus_malaysianus.AAC.1